MNTALVILNALVCVGLALHLWLHRRTPHVTTTVVRPGDTVVLSTPNPLTAEDVHRIRSAASDEMPGVNVLVVAGLSVACAVRTSPDCPLCASPAPDCLTSTRNTEEATK